MRKMWMDVEEATRWSGPVLEAAVHLVMVARGGTDPLGDEPKLANALYHRIETRWSASFEHTRSTDDAARAYCRAALDEWRAYVARPAH